MPKRNLTKEEILATPEGKQHLAIALILYSDFRGSIGVDWVERGTELIKTAEAFGVQEQVKEWTAKIPKGKWQL